MTTHNTTSTAKYATLLSVFLLATGMAAASVSSITGDSADNVEIGNAATNLGQNTTFNFTIDHNSAFENVSLNISNAPNSDQINITGDGSDVYLNTSGVNVSDVYGPTSNVINISLGNQTAGAVDVSLTANLTHNVSGVNSEHSGVQYNLTNAGETDYGTVSFDYQDTVTPSVTGVTVRDNESSGDNIVNSSDSVYVEATVTDAGTGVDTVQVNNSDFFSGTSTVELTSKSGSDVYNASFDVGNSPSVSDGSVSLKVKANDTAGNLNDSKSDSVTLDTTAPTYDSATTGNTTGGDTTRNKVVLSFTEATSGLNSSTVETSDFAVEGSSLKVSSVSNVASEQVTLTLNDTIQTDATPYVNLTGTVSDDAGNSVSSVDVEASDGLKAEVNSVETVDLGTDGDIDSVKVTYSEDVTNVGTDELNISGSNSTDAKETSPGVVRYNLSSDVSGTSATPTVEFTESNIQDAQGGYDLASTTISDATDSAAPVLLHAEIDSSASSSSVTNVSLKFSEKISSGTGDLTTDQSSTALNVGSTPSSSTVTATVQDGSNNNKVLQTGDNPMITDASVLGDGSSNSAVLENRNNVEIDTFRRTLGSGWNFVSFPIADTTTPKISNVIDTSNVNAIWKYDDGQWMSYKPGRSDSKNDFTEFEGGVGYQIDASSQFTIAPNVNNVKTTQGFAQVQLEEGYNLVGQFEEFNQNADANGAFASIGSSLGSVYKQQTGFQVTDITGTTDGAKTGNAYWVQTVGDLSDGTVAYTAN